MAINKKNKAIETKPRVKDFKDFSAKARFRVKGTKYINPTPEVKEHIREVVETHFAALAEKEELKRLVGSGEITTDDEVLAYFDRSLSKQMAIIARKKEQEFQTSLVSMTPKDKEKATAVRNLTRAVFKKAIEKITTKDEALQDARAIMELYEQGAGIGREGVLAKLIAEEKKPKPTVDLQRYIAKEVD